MEGVFRCADPPQRLLGKQALIGEVVDGQDGGKPDVLPREIGGHEGCLPIIGVNQVGCPVLVQTACRQFSRDRGKSAEADIIVRPVAAGGVAIGVARAVVKLRAEQYVDGQAVPGRRQSHHAGRHFRHRRALANDLNMRELFDDVAIAGEQDPDVGPEPQRPGQGRRNGREAAHPDKVVHLGGDEQNSQKCPRSPRWRKLMQERFQFSLLG